MRLARLAAASLLAAVACSSATPRAEAASEQATVEATAHEALVALGKRDMDRLAALAHSTRDVRFSPHATVNLRSDRVVSAAAVAGLWRDTLAYVWGVEDGSGNDIRLPFARYYPRFIFDRDYTRAPQTAYTAAALKPGNAPSNLAAVYPDGRWVEYHFPGLDPKYEGMDWSSLWLVFERDGARWGLVGVVHGRWTI